MVLRSNPLLVGMVQPLANLSHNSGRLGWGNRRLGQPLGKRHSADVLGDGVVLASGETSQVKDRDDGRMIEAGQRLSLLAAVTYRGS